MFSLASWLTPQTVQNHAPLIQRTLRSLTDEELSGATEAFNAVRTILSDEYTRRMGETLFGSEVIK